MSLITLNISENGSSTASSSQLSAAYIENKVFAYIFVLLNAPSVICNAGLLIHYFLYQRKQPTQCLFPFTIVCLLIVSMLVTEIDLPFVFIPQAIETSYVGNLHSPESFCIFFHFFDTTLYILELWLLSLVSYERYLLIFSSNFTQRTRMKRYFFHYFPVFLMVTFIIIFLFYLHILLPCENTDVYDPIIKNCKFACFYRKASPQLLSAALIISYTLPVFIATVLDLLLIGHIVYQKHHMLRILAVNSINANKRQKMQETWKRTKKLFKQFLPLTILFFITELPWALRQALRTIFPGSLDGIPVEFEIFLANLTVIYQLLIVFTIFLNQQELKSKFRELMKRLWANGRRILFRVNRIASLSVQASIIRTTGEHH